MCSSHPAFPSHLVKLEGNLWLKYLCSEQKYFHCLFDNIFSPLSFASSSLSSTVNSGICAVHETEEGFIYSASNGLDKKDMVSDSLLSSSGPGISNAHAGCVNE